MHSAICRHLLGVMVLHTSMLDWKGEDGVSQPLGICAFCYMCTTAIGCNGFEYMGMYAL